MVTKFKLGDNVYELAAPQALTLRDSIAWSNDPDAITFKINSLEAIDNIFTAVRNNATDPDKAAHALANTGVSDHLALAVVLWLCIVNHERAQGSTAAVPFARVLDTPLEADSIMWIEDPVKQPTDRLGPGGKAPARKGTTAGKQTSRSTTATGNLNESAPAG